MQAYDVITQKEFLLKHGYLFVEHNKPAAKIVIINTHKRVPTIEVEIIAQLGNGGFISVCKKWTEEFSDVVIS